MIVFVLIPTLTYPIESLSRFVQDFDISILLGFLKYLEKNFKVDEILKTIGYISFAYYHRNFSNLVKYQILSNAPREIGNYCKWHDVQLNTW